MTSTPLDIEKGEESELVEALAVQRRAWDSRPLVRALYREWFADIRSSLSSADGPTIEVGAGIGALKESLPQITTTDAMPTPWADEVVDAEDLPYDDESVGNIVMVDVLHHLPDPLRFLTEAQRVLAAGGHLVMVEPYCSVLSMLAYRFLHHEDVSMSADPTDGSPQSSNRLLDANIAVPTLLFWRYLPEVLNRASSMALIERKRFACVAYPLSGGFTRRPFVTSGALPVLRAAERLLQPLAWLLAFRCKVVLEKH